jgi:hypothetical protein
MFKVVLIIIGFLNGEAAGLITPAPVFDTMTACVEFYEKEKVYLPAGHSVQAFCVSADEVKEVQ